MTPVLLPQRMGQSKKPLRLLQLKQEGHDLIDTLVADGLGRTRVYNRLRNRLAGTGISNHFADINEIGEAQFVVKILTEWIAQRKQTREEQMTPSLKQIRKAERRAAKKANVLPRELYLKAMEEMRQDHIRGVGKMVATHPSRWTRVKRWLKIKLWQTKTR